MQFYKDGFRGGNPDVREAAPNRRNRGRDEPLPDKVDVLIAGTGPAGLCLAAQLSQFPAIETMIVERMSGNIIKGKADGINTRTMEMFQAFGFADKVKRETYWVNQTAFWMPDPKNPEHIKRVGRVQDVADDSSEMPHILINQARLHELFLEVMKNSPSRLEPDYGWEIVGLTIDDTIDDHPVTVTLKDATGLNWGVTRTVRANYVVGCDGARSVTQRAAQRSCLAIGPQRASARQIQTTHSTSFLAHIPWRDSRPRTPHPQGPALLDSSLCESCASHPQCANGPAFDDRSSPPTFNSAT